MEFGEWLRDQLHKNGLNQPKLAELLGVNQSTISNWITGKVVPSVDNLVALAGVFKYDQMALMEMLGIVRVERGEELSSEEKQVINRLKMLRGSSEYRPTAQTVISMIDLVLAAKDSSDDED